MFITTYLGGRNRMAGYVCSFYQVSKKVSKRISKAQLKGWGGVHNLTLRYNNPLAK